MKKEKLPKENCTKIWKAKLKILTKKYKNFIYEKKENSKGKTDKLRRRKIEKREFWKMMNLISEEDIGEIDKELFETTAHSAT